MNLNANVGRFTEHDIEKNNNLSTELYKIDKENSSVIQNE